MKSIFFILFSVIISTCIAQKSSSKLHIMSVDNQILNIITIDSKSSEIVITKYYYY